MMRTFDGILLFDRLLEGRNVPKRQQEQNYHILLVLDGRNLHQ